MSITHEQSKLLREFHSLPPDQEGTVTNIMRRHGVRLTNVLKNVGRKRYVSPSLTSPPQTPWPHCVFPPVTPFQACNAISCLRSLGLPLVLMGVACKRKRATPPGLPHHAMVWEVMVALSSILFSIVSILTTTLSLVAASFVHETFILHNLSIDFSPCAVLHRRLHPSTLCSSFFTSFGYVRFGKAKPCIGINGLLSRGA